MVHRILLSNMGYARDIGGGLAQHIRYAHRHFHASQGPQMRSIEGLKAIIKAHQPDMCCLLEIDKGSLNNAYYNQIHALIDPHYHFYDIENKYAETSRLRKISVANGKCNGFIARSEVEFQKHYLSIGAKRLVYSIKLKDDLTLIFTHFALRKATRKRQFQDLHALVRQINGNVIILGDFNIFAGFDEVEPLLTDLPLKIISDPNIPTFKFSRFRKCVDLCIASEAIADKCKITVVPQPYSDHEALLVEVG